MRQLLALIAILTLAACTTQTPLPTPFPTPMLALTQKEVEQWNFVNTVRDSVNRNINVHPAAKQAKVRFYDNTPAMLFNQGKGFILQFKIPETPADQEAAMMTVYMIVSAAVGKAYLQKLQLDGVEIIYYDEGEPTVGYTAVEPWGVDQILLVPVGE